MDTVSEKAKFLKEIIDQRQKLQNRKRLLDEEINMVIAMENKVAHEIMTQQRWHQRCYLNNSFPYISDVQSKCSKLNATNKSWHK